jgi:predicted transcriptional regulator
MTKEQIESVFERVRTWSRPLQEEAVEMLLAIEAMGDRPLALSEDERHGVERGLDDMRNGRFASDEDVAALLARYKS